MAQTDYTQPVLRYHAVPERHDKLRLGNATKRWLSADVATVTAATLSVSGTSTLSGATSVAGALTLTGAVAGVRATATVTTAATYTIVESESGTVFLCTRGSTTQVFTLPSAATGGLMYTFVCGNVSTEIHLKCAGAEQIFAKTDAAADGTALVTTATTGLLKNTAASNVVGDHMLIVSDGVGAWYSASIAGAWSAT